MTTDTLLKTSYASDAIDDDALDRLFRAARTQNGWLDRPVSEALLRQAVDLAKMGPTSANTLPMRLVFVNSAEAKARLKPALLPQNLEKTMRAPVTAIVGYDLGFPDLLPKLFPHADARAWFAGNDELIADTAYRNGSLQGGYFILALRAVGLDVGHIIDVRVYVVIEHPDDAITLALEISFPASIIGDLAILRVRRAVDLDNEPRFPA